MGSSATISAGVPIRPMPIIARWRIPPENSWGYWCARRSGVGDPHRPQPVDGTGQRRLAAETMVVAGHLGELAADAAGRVERGHRVLEHHRQGGAEQAPLHLRVPRPQVGAEQLEPGGLDPARVGDEARDRQGGQRLARSGLPHDADRLAPPDGEGQAAYRADGAMGSREGDLEVADVEHHVGRVARRVGRNGRRRRGHRPGLRPEGAGRRRWCRCPRPLATDSPKRLNARPATSTASPGASAAAGLT